MNYYKVVGVLAVLLVFTGAGCDSGLVGADNDGTYSVVDSSVEVGSNGYLDEAVEVDGVKTIINPEDLVKSGQGIDGLPPLTDAKFVSIEAGEKRMMEEYNIGYFGDFYGFMIDGAEDMRFYPYQILAWHEVVNDTFEGEPILVTYGELAFHGGVYSRTMENGDVLTFGNSGLLWNNASVLYDHETNSLWSPLLGKAIYGELAGTKLVRLPGPVITWDDYKALVESWTGGAIGPGTVMSMDTGYERMYSRSPYGEYLISKVINFPLTAKVGKAFPPKDGVIGVEVNDVAKAYHIPTLMNMEDDVLEDEIGGVDVKVYQRDGIWHVVTADDKEELDTVFTLWFTWSVVHQDSEVYGVVRGKGLVNGVFELNNDEGVGDDDGAVHIKVDASL